MKVLIPSPLRSYTKKREVEATGATLAELLAELDRRYPGLRFRMIDEQDRMRRHIRFFIKRGKRGRFPFREEKGTLPFSGKGGRFLFAFFLALLPENRSEQ